MNEPTISQYLHYKRVSVDHSIFTDNYKNKYLHIVNKTECQMCGMIRNLFFRLIWRGGESYVYMYIYNNYRLFDLEWDNVWTWYAAAIGVDFCYYWVHRACHGEYSYLLSPFVSFSRIFTANDEL